MDYVTYGTGPVHGIGPDAVIAEGDRSHTTELRPPRPRQPRRRRQGPRGRPPRGTGRVRRTAPAGVDAGGPRGAGRAGGPREVPDVPGARARCRTCRRPARGAGRVGGAGHLTRRTTTPAPAHRGRAGRR
ncbi:hypothetical protein [Streptomyces sp. NPDC048392]|uniref:hypothetical protein n=1 Tax=Streptomyces sp. NPDC048392 TaxID=3365543 RepID=UPI0037233AAB